METFSRKKTVWAWTMASLVIFATALFLTACGDGGGKKKASTPGSTAYGRRCSTCRSGATVLTSGLSNSYTNQVQFALDFFAEGHLGSGTFNPNYGYGTGFGSGYGIANGYYTGSVRAEGFMYVRNGNMFGCTIPNGDYTVRTIGAGTWDFSGMAQRVQLEARGGSVIVNMTLEYATFLQAIPKRISCRRAVYDSEMLGAITVTSIQDGRYGGISCQGYITLSGFQNAVCPMQ